MERKYAECLKDLALTGNTDLADILVDLDEGDDGLALLGATKLAKEIKPKWWEKIVAKIPGVCSYMSMSEKKLKKKLQLAKFYIEQIKKAEKMGKTSMVDELGKKAMQLADPYNEPPGSFNWKMYKKSYLAWMKTGEMLQEMRRDGKPAEGMQEACRNRKGKKKRKK